MKIQFTILIPLLKKKICTFTLNCLKNRTVSENELGIKYPAIFYMS